jgi:D-inositol-3-phosphate glycosyltransferase
MKRIAIISPAHPLRGGIAASTELLALQLMSEGHTVVIFSFSMQYPGFLFPGKTQYTDDPPLATLDIRPLIHSLNPLNWLRIGKMLKSARFDIVLARYWMPFMAPAIGTILRIAKSNGYSRIIGLTDNFKPHEPRPGDALLNRFFTGSADAFIAMSREVEKQIREAAPGKPVAYVPHPIYNQYGPIAEREDSIAHLKLPPASGYVLFFGFIRDYKGLDILLHAMALPEIRPLNLHLIIAGEFYGNAQKYHELIEHLRLGNSLTLFDQFIPSADVRYYFGAADLLVQPYRSATQSGISQMAVHFEKPMVATAVGGLAEVIDHHKTGYIVPVHAQAVADAIHDFFVHQRAQPMTTAVRQIKDNFSWEALSKTVVSI